MIDRASTPTTRLLQRALATATASVCAARAHIEQHRRKAGGATARRKGDGDFVTALDVACERLLAQRLCAELPLAGFVGEETPARDTDRDLVWVVDPIDGTSNFANGLPHWAIAVALLWRRSPVVAVAWCEPEGALYHAVVGRGAFRAGRRLRPPRGRWDDGTIVGSQWHRGSQDLRFLAALQRDGARVRTFGSTVAQLIDVASGRLDGNAQQQGHVWDFAAAGLIAVEAGCRVTDWRGRPLFPLPTLTAGHTATIAAPPLVHRQLLRALQPFARAARLDSGAVVPPTQRRPRRR